MPDRYKDIPIFKTDTGKRFYSTPIFPTISPSIDDIYIQSSEGDRFDLLAKEYYNDSTLWWVIAAANPRANTGSLVVPPGIQLRIPANKNEVLLEYRNFNESR